MLLQSSHAYNHLFIFFLSFIWLFTCCSSFAPQPPNNNNNDNNWDVKRKWDFSSKYSPEHVIWGERSNEMYGSSVSIWDNYMLVGAYGDKSNGEMETGAVYVYERHDTNNEHDNWKQTVVLHPNDGKSGDQYGYAVALDSYLALIGSPKHDATGENSGAVYLYQRDIIAQQQQHQEPKHRHLQGGGAGAGGHHNQLTLTSKLTVPHIDKGGYNHFYYFGCSVSVHINTSVIGAWNCVSDDTKVTGCAFVWRRTQHRVYQGPHGESHWESSWEYFQRLLPTDSQNDLRFGYSVSVFGETIAIGAPGLEIKDSHDVIGSVYIFESEAATATNYVGWKQTTKLKPSDGEDSDGYGMAVCLWDDNLLIGSPYHSLQDGDNYILAAGRVYSFHHSKYGEWSLIEEIFPKYPVIQGHFGFSLDIYHKLAAIGAYNSAIDGSGKVYLYGEHQTEEGTFYWDYITHRQPEKEIPGDMYGYAVSVYYSTIAVGAYGASLAWENPREVKDQTIFKNGGVYVYTAHEERMISYISYLAQNVLVTFSVFVVMSTTCTAIIFFGLNQLGLVSKSTSKKGSGGSKHSKKGGSSGVEVLSGDSSHSSHSLMGSFSSHSGISDMDVSRVSNFYGTDSNNNNNSNNNSSNTSTTINLNDIEEEGRRKKTTAQVFEIHQ